MIKMKRGLLRLGMAAAMAAGGIGVVSATPATAASQYCTLRIYDNRDDSRYEDLRSDCYNRPPQDKVLYLEIWGEDTFSDDFLYRTYDAHYDLQITNVADYMLDEDDGADEIYVQLTLQRPNGKKYSVRSNKVTSYWS